MKILIYNAKELHHKNAIGLKQILEYLKYDYLFTNNQNIDISYYDIIYSPAIPIKQNIGNKKFIYGPHFSVFPNEKIKQIPIGQKAIYIQPSQWAKNVWQNKIPIPVKVFSFPIDTTKFIDLNLNKTKIFVYTKRRDPLHVNYVLNFLKQNKINFEFFDYIQRYKEEDYLRILQQSKYGIIIDAHESQGFAIEEALSCNVPLLVWNVKTMNQEWKSRYGEIQCTSIPYWDERCGEFFYNQEEFFPTFQNFINNVEIKKYKPREFILENLNVESCSKRFKELIEF